MESTSSQEVLVCETCGDKGYTNAFVYCIKCVGAGIHRYCLDALPKTADDFVSWLCEDCKPTVPYPFTLPKKLNPSISPKEKTTSSPHVKTPHRKKNQKKKKKISLLVAGKDEVIETERNPVSLADSPLKEASAELEPGPNEITPCGVSKKQVEVLESSPLKGNAKRKRNKPEDSTGHSCCDSSCTDVTLKTCDKEDQECEIQRAEIGNDKLVSESSSIEKEMNKKIKKYNCEADSANRMRNEEDMRVRKTGADDFQVAGLNNNEQHANYESARPVLDPVWRGSFNITQTDYDVLEEFVGHLSSKACKKVCEEATLLPSSLCLEMHSKTALWPKSFLDSHPSDENIALYFFPGDTKVERCFEHLVMDMVDEGLAMRAIAKNAELLIFTSTVLPMSYWRFQGKYYLWGVFRGKRNDSLPPLTRNLAVINNCDSHGKEILTRLKTSDSRSPQSPLCDYRSSITMTNRTTTNIMESLSLKSMLGKDKLIGPNFLDWYRNLRIVLKHERKFYVLEAPSVIPPKGASTTVQSAYDKHLEDDIDVGCMMLATMSPVLQKQHENMNAFDMIEHLKSLFQGQDKQVKFDTYRKKGMTTFENRGNGKSKAFFQCNKKRNDGPKAPKPVVSKNKKESTPKTGSCYYCHEPGHWKRNCLKFLQDLKQNKA